MKDFIKSNYQKINNQIMKTCEYADRNSDSIKLIVVTKGQPINLIEDVIDAGAQFIGENYPEETSKKISNINPINKEKVQWHLIGHLQSRKVNIATEIFNCVQSVDRIKIADKLNQSMKQKNKILPICLQYNIGGEIQKFGWEASNEKNWGALLEDFDQVTKFSNLKIVGLMTMPPFTLDKRISRNNFSKLRKLRDYFQRNFKNIDLCELSMGTSHDFEEAIKEGATILRVGTAIMGDRIFS